MTWVAAHETLASQLPTRPVHRANNMTHKNVDTTGRRRIGPATAVFRMQPINRKDWGKHTLSAAAKHNKREIPDKRERIDPTRSHLNVSLLGLPPEFVRVREGDHRAEDWDSDAGEFRHTAQPAGCPEKAAAKAWVQAALATAQAARKPAAAL